MLFFINDLPYVATSTLKLFADDIKIYKKINDISDEILLQEDLNKLHQWSVKWQLKFNAKNVKWGDNTGYSNRGNGSGCSDIDEELTIHKHISAKYERPTKP